MTFPFLAGSRATAAGIDAVLPQVSYVVADVPIAQTTGVALMSFSVVPGTWRIEGTISWIQGGVAGKQAMRITGPSASLVRCTLREVVTSATGESVWVNTINALNTDLNNNSAGQTIGDSYVWDFDGVFVFTAAGTVVVEARCVTSAADTYTVKAGSAATMLQG